MSIFLRVRLALAALAFLPGPALLADVAIDLEFNVDAQYPTQNGQPFVYFGGGNGSSDVNGSPDFHVSGGLLQQSTLTGNGDSEYFYNGGGTFLSSLNTYVEVRMRVLADSGGSGDISSAIVDLSNNTYRYNIDVRPGSVLINYNAGTIASGSGFDGTQFHTYGLLALANSSQYSFFIDGENVFTGAGKSGNGNFFQFGDGSGISSRGTGAQAEYDYIRVTNAVGVVPEPSVTALLGVTIALGGVIAVGRSRRRNQVQHPDPVFPVGGDQSSLSGY